MDINNMLNNLEQQAARNVKAEQGDYIVDGLLYCHKCKTPKQVRVEILGQVRTPYCLCKCASEKREAEEAALKRQDFMLEVKRLRKMGFLDAEMRSWNFSIDDLSNKRVSSIANKYVDSFDEILKKGKGLVFHGNVGSGKTFIAACIANALIDKGYACLVTNFARLTNTISGMYEGKQEYIDGLNKFSLLVIDDLAAERDTEYMNESIYNIIDARYRAGKPIIVTTNLTLDELMNPEDSRKERVYSRILEMCIPVEVKNNDHRKKKLQSDYQDYREILGL